MVKKALKKTALGGELLRLEGIRRGYGEVRVLDGVDLLLHSGEAVAIVGPSGSGKSTLLQIAGLLDTPDAGVVAVEGKVVSKLGDDGRARLRNRVCGYVYQFHHLLREFSALENVMMPGMIGGVGNGRKRALELLDRVGLSARATHYPDQLSGGEQQRVALARALMNQPKLLLADEPTGNLDPHTAEVVAGLLFDLVRDEGMSVLMVTHNLALAGRCGRVIEMERLAG